MARGAGNRQTCAHRPANDGHCCVKSASRCLYPCSDDPTFQGVSPGGQSPQQQESRDEVHSGTNRKSCNPHPQAIRAARTCNAACAERHQQTARKHEPNRINRSDHCDRDPQQARLMSNQQPRGDNSQQDVRDNPGCPRAEKDTGLDPEKHGNRDSQVQ